MTKADLIQAVSDMTKQPKRPIQQTLEVAFKFLAEQLKVEDQLTWPRFGTFKVVDRAAREGRNPNTGEKIQIPAKKAVKFVAAKGLREEING